MAKSRISAVPREEAPQPAPESWSAERSSELYRLDAWGEGFFFINEQGHAAVRPLPDSDVAIDIVQVVADIRRRNSGFPVLIRFQDVLRARVRRLNEAFAAAVAESGYGNVYRGVYPIKVNQMHEVVEEVLDAGRPWGMGLECGSKAELVAALPHIDDERLLLCNGVKDRTMLSLILSAQQLGQKVLPIIEKYSEFEQLLALADAAGVKPKMAARIRLATQGSGRWFESAGARSKFGIAIPELVRMVQELERRDSRDSLQLLHFHLGSQIADIQVLKQAVTEAGQVYASLVKQGIRVTHLDVGGGLGVNYGAGYTRDEDGINYGLQEYANAVVYAVKDVCDAREVPPPVIVSESGRAITAHHSVLIVPVLGTHRPDGPVEGELPEKPHKTVKGLKKILDGLRRRNNTPEELLEAYHDAKDARNEADQLFALGYLALDQLAAVQRLYWNVCSEILPGLRAAELDPVPDELPELEERLTDLYLCDFSVFQSMLDHWAIEQGFPVMPIDRLEENPGRRGVMVDLTCDSDGKISHYISSLDDKSFLPVHGLKPDEPYYIGIFLVGAYQDIMGDTHNLFGRVPEVHVYADAEEPGNFWIEKQIPGMTVHEMLAQVQYFPNDLNRRMSELVRRRIDAGQVRPGVGMQILDQYTACFNETTYCIPG
jgi:arginine decarboxylase